ncbi:hypothetical protein HDU67_008034 [Dinochytrium kinnereticum]|nr:hypothetical protein HDU67_008034 [Dinochytrium kinnereticum]
MVANDALTHAWEVSLPTRYAAGAPLPPSTYTSASSLTPKRAISSPDSGRIVHVQFVNSSKGGLSFQSWSDGIEFICLQVSSAGDGVYSLRTGERISPVDGEYFSTMYATLSRGATAPYHVSAKIGSAADPFRLSTFDTVLGPVKVKESPAFPGILERLGDISRYEYQGDDFEIHAGGNRILFAATKGGEWVTFACYEFDGHATKFLFAKEWVEPKPEKWFDNRLKPAIQANQDYFVITRSTSGYGLTPEEAAKIPAKRIYVHRMTDGSLVGSMEIRERRQVTLTKTHLLLFSEHGTHVSLSLHKLDENLTEVYKDLKVTFPQRPESAHPEGGDYSLHYAGMTISPDGSMILYRREHDLVIVDVISGKTHLVSVPGDPAFGKLECLVVKEVDAVSRDLEFDFIRAQL